MKLIANASIGVKVALAPAFALLCLALLKLLAPMIGGYLGPGVV